MKTKNNLLKGIIIGIGVIVVPLILMSTTYTTEKKNKSEFVDGQSGMILLHISVHVAIIFCGFVG